MRIGSLFSGIGGLELGLERSGLGQVAWQVEIDPFCRQVLAKHWPNVTRYDDVKAVGLENLPSVDIICGGFPCQDVSSAGKGAGLSGARSGLWYEYLRIVGELHPRIVIVENVSSGKKRWLPFVRADLEALGYETVPLEIGAVDVGAPHKRLRVFVVAYANGHGKPASSIDGEMAYTCQDASCVTPDPERHELWDKSGRGSGAHGQGTREFGDVSETRDATNSDVAGCEGDERAGVVEAPGRYESTERPWTNDTMPQPAIRRVDDGVSAGMDRSRRQRRNQRLKALGNAVVPQCAEAVGHWVMGHCHV